MCVIVQGRYLVEVRLFGYSNPTGRCRGCPPFDGSQSQSCCDAFDTTTCSSELLCDSYFIYCLRPLGSSEGSGCSNFESRMSTVNTDDEPIDFSRRKVLGLNNPLLLSPGFTDTYSVSNDIVIHFISMQQSPATKQFHTIPYA